MNIYAINICTDTKTNDRYHKVAVNPYPIIVFGDENDLKMHLQSDATNAYIKNLFRTKQLFDAAVYRIRVIPEDRWVKEFEWKLPDINKVNYEEV